METLINHLSKEQKIQLLSKLLEKSKEANSLNIDDPLFKDWKILVYRTLRNIFGEHSIELNEFANLKFRNNYFGNIPYSAKSEENENLFREDFQTTINYINQYLDELNSVNETEVIIQSKKEFPKIRWQGTQKELGELFIELNRKGWINEISTSLIKNYFSDSNTIDQVLKPSKDKEGNSNYDGVYTKAYKPKFDSIRMNQKEK